MHVKFPRILYFIKGQVPSPKDYVEAIKYGTNVVFRDATRIGDEMLEECDGVAGAVPKRYADAKKHASEVVRDFFGKMGSLFHTGATVTGIEAQQLRAKIEAEIRADLTGQFDAAIKQAQSTFDAQLAAKSDELEKAKARIVEVEAMLARAAEGDSKSGTNTVTPEAPKEAPKADAGWSPNV